MDAWKEWVRFAESEMKEINATVQHMEWRRKLLLCADEAMCDMRNHTVDATDADALRKALAKLEGPVCSRADQLKILKGFEADGSLNAEDYMASVYAEYDAKLEGGE